MSFAGLGDFGGSGAPPYDQGAPAQGSLGAPGDPGAPGAPGEVRGVADFFGGGAAPGFGGGKKRTTTHPFFFLPAPACTCMQIIQMCLTLATSLYPDILPTTAGALALSISLGDAFRILHSSFAGGSSREDLCFAMLIPHVYRAWMQDPSSLQVSFFPSGPLLHLVKLVGVVDVPSRETLEAALHSARIQFTLDDFTGRIECEYTVGDELTEYRQNQILDALCCGGLVTIFGSINLLGKSEPSLRVHAIRQTQTAADLIYHESACQAAYLRLKYPNEDPDGATGAGQQQSLQPSLLQQQQQQMHPFGVPQRRTALSCTWPERHEQP
ncbi:replication protein A2, putative [Eimeria acervulina]|uniref:Replication protein A2, putative n=1 Tax=Eimeria acervulina TaxID=5801 RepID=U6GT62_EIMAC|nr:replication protein A2, putative [Eimeria acervulina]CDI82458.1 replication protein A2, putative [Eimeria acervulina]